MVCYIDVKFFLYYLLASQSSGEVRSPNLLVNPNDFLADSDTDALFGYVFLYCKNVVIVVNLKSLLECVNAGGSVCEAHIPSCIHTLLFA